MAKSGHRYSHQRQPVQASSRVATGKPFSSMERTFCGQNATHMPHFLHHPLYTSTLFMIRTAWRWHAAIC